LYSVSVETDFQALHQLRLADGSKEPLHLHNWRVKVTVSRENLSRMGLVVDFNRLKAAVSEVVEPVGGASLSDIDYFRTNNPSAEAVAKYIYEKLEQKIPAGAKLKSVSVVEEPGCTAKFGK